MITILKHIKNHDSNESLECMLETIEMLEKNFAMDIFMDVEEFNIVKKWLERYYGELKQMLIMGRKKENQEDKINKTRNEKLKEDYAVKLNQRQSYLVMINCLSILWHHAFNKMHDGGYEMKKTLEFILEESAKYTDLYNSELNGEVKE